MWFLKWLTQVREVPWFLRQVCIWVMHRIGNFLMSLSNLHIIHNWNWLPNCTRAQKSQRRRARDNRQSLQAALSANSLGRSRVRRALVSSAWDLIACIALAWTIKTTTWCNSSNCSIRWRIQVSMPAILACWAIMRASKDQMSGTVACWCLCLAPQELSTSLTARNKYRRSTKRTCRCSKHFNQLNRRLRTSSGASMPSSSKNIRRIFLITQVRVLATLQ